MKQCKYAEWDYVDIIDNKQHSGKWCFIHKKECAPEGCKDYVEKED